MQATLHGRRRESDVDAANAGQQIRGQQKRQPPPAEFPHREPFNRTGHRSLLELPLGRGLWAAGVQPAERSRSVSAASTANRSVTATL